MNDHVHDVELQDRGVYWRCALSPDGHPIAYAVDSHGREIRSEPVLHPQLAAATIAVLWRVLDDEDPQPLASDVVGKGYRRGYRERNHLSLVQ